MATEPFDDMPKITLEKDDLDSFHRNRTQSKKSESIDSGKASEPAPSRSPSWFAFLFLLLLIVAGAAYWSFEQYKVLTQAQNRITELEGRLSATGEEMDQSAVALQVKVKELSAKTAELWEQMDKLWASAWRRNQSDISNLKKSLASVKSASEKSTATLSNTVSSNNSDVVLLKEQLANQVSILKQLEEQLVLANSSEAETEQQLASLREKLISTALANNNLTNRIDDLDRRLKSTEQKAAQSNSAAVGP